MSEESSHNEELKQARERQHEAEERRKRLVTGFDAMIRFQQYLWTLASLPNGNEVDAMIGEILDTLRLMDTTAERSAAALSYFQNIGEACRNLSEVGRSAGDQLEPLISTLRDLTQAYRETNDQAK